MPVPFPSYPCKEIHGQGAVRGYEGMKAWFRSLQIAFTFIGTVVGAGFATGKEVLQFFTRFGHWGALLIATATLFFVWLGAKMMLLAAQIKARSYEDLNKHLFGERAGAWVSHLMLVVLMSVNSVMLAGAGTIFSEQLQMSYQSGMFITLIACFFLLRKGISAIVSVNLLVVPVMILFTFALVIDTMRGPGADRWLTLRSDLSPAAAWLSPLLYASFNLTMSQSVLVPLGSVIGDAKILRRGAWLGGIGIGTMLLAGHFALSAHMPGAQQFDIPMGDIARELGPWMHAIFVFLIFAEIFTTLVADLYGLSLQLEERIRLPRTWLTLSLLLFCLILGQFGFGPLLTTLYPLFGLLSLGWLLLIILDRRLRRKPPHSPTAS